MPFSRTRRWWKASTIYLRTQTETELELITRLAIPHLKKSQAGVIINMSSVDLTEEKTKEYIRELLQSLAEWTNKLSAQSK